MADTSAFVHALRQAEHRLQAATERAAALQQEDDALRKEVEAGSRSLEQRKAAVESKTAEVEKMRADVSSRQTAARAKDNKVNAEVDGLRKETAQLLRTSSQQLSTQTRDFDSKQQASNIRTMLQVKQGKDTSRQEPQHPAAVKAAAPRNTHSISTAPAPGVLGKATRSYVELSRRFGGARLPEGLLSSTVHLHEQPSHVRISRTGIELSAEVDRAADYSSMSSADEDRVEARVVVARRGAKSNPKSIEFLVLGYDGRVGKNACFGGAYDAEKDHGPPGDDTTLINVVRRHFPQLPSDALLTRFVDFTYKSRSGVQTQHVYYLCDLVDSITPVTLSAAAVFVTEQEKKQVQHEESYEEEEEVEVETPQEEGIEGEVEEPQEKKTVKKTVTKTRQVTKEEVCDVEKQKPAWNPVFVPLEDLLTTTEKWPYPLAEGELRLAASALDEAMRLRHGEVVYRALGEVVSRKRKLAELGVSEEGVHGLEHGYEPSSLRRRVESTSVLNNEVVESFRFFDQAGKKSVELRTILDTFVGLNKCQSLAALKKLAEEAGFHNDEFRYLDKLPVVTYNSVSEATNPVPVDTTLFPSVL
eukprot:Rhum_TRINITY_DN4894_c0_g1::Rhum_TRINITY_DN4894_c0_g1_i1::g.15770::m.15770